MKLVVLGAFLLGFGPAVRLVLLSVVFDRCGRVLAGAGLCFVCVSMCLACFPYFLGVFLLSLDLALFSVLFLLLPLCVLFFVFVIFSIVLFTSLLLPLRFCF